MHHGIVFYMGSGKRNTRSTVEHKQSTVIGILSLRRTVRRLEEASVSEEEEKEDLDGERSRRR